MLVRKTYYGWKFKTQNYGLFPYEFIVHIFFIDFWKFIHTFSKFKTSKDSPVVETSSLSCSLANLASESYKTTKNMNYKKYFDLSEKTQTLIEHFIGKLLNSLKKGENTTKITKITEHARIVCTVYHLKFQVYQFPIALAHYMMENL